MTTKALRNFSLASAVLILIGSALLLFLPKQQIFVYKKLPLIPEAKPTTLFFAGDIMLSRNVAARMYQANDYTLPFLKVKDQVESADISFANLESPINETGDHSVEKSLIFNADPKAVEGLNFAGFDILSTANNHAFDQGRTGIDFTKTWLTQHGIIPIGTGASCHLGQIITRNQIKFGYLAYSYTAFNSGTNQPDPQVCDAYDLDQVKTDVTALRDQADVVIVAVHAGTEYTRTPNEFQIKFVQTASLAGADLIIGAHPHWIQKPIEKLNNKTWVFYSLGNFVFDQMWSQDTREGMTVKVTYKEKLIDKIELMPVIIDNYCCPRWANNEETKSILTKLDLTSTVVIQHN